MLHAGLDVSRTRVDYRLLNERGDRVEVGAAPPDGDGLRGFARRVALRHGPVPVRAAIESMNDARFVHDTLEQCSGEVEVADVQKVKGLAPLACKTDRIDARVLAELSSKQLVHAICCRRSRYAPSASVPAGAFLFEPPDALAELSELLALIAGQPIVAFSAIELVLLDPVAQRLLRDAEALGDVADRASRAHEPDGVIPEVLRIRRPGPGHREHPSRRA
jgi:hypothetical protein